MSKNGLHTLPLHVGDLVKETAHLTHDQFGVYMRLLLVHFQLGTDGIPRARLPHLARVTPKVWQRKYADTLEPLFEGSGDRVVLPRLVATLQDLYTRTQAQRDKALKRWHSADAAAVPAEKPETEKQKPKEESKDSFPVAAVTDSAQGDYLHEKFEGILTAEEFYQKLPERWKKIYEEKGLEKDFLAATGMGFWQRFVGRYPGDPQLTERFTRKKNWEKAWEFECDRLHRIQRGLPPRNDLPHQRAKLVKGW